MKPNRRKLVRHSFMAVVTGTSALALQACSDTGDQQGNNSAKQTEESSNSDSDSQ